MACQRSSIIKQLLKEILICFVGTGSSKAQHMKIHYVVPNELLLNHYYFLSKVYDLHLLKFVGKILVSKVKTDNYQKWNSLLSV